MSPARLSALVLSWCMSMFLTAVFLAATPYLLILQMKVLLFVIENPLAFWGVALLLFFSIWHPVYRIIRWALST